jgi:hypothetical protein
MCIARMKRALSTGAALSPGALSALRAAGKAPSSCAIESSWTSQSMAEPRVLGTLERPALTSVNWGQPRETARLLATAHGDTCDENHTIGHRGGWTLAEALGSKAPRADLKLSSRWSGFVSYQIVAL